MRDFVLPYRTLVLGLSVSLSCLSSVFSCDSSAQDAALLCFSRASMQIPVCSLKYFEGFLGKPLRSVCIKGFRDNEERLTCINKEVMPYSILKMES